MFLCLHVVADGRNDFTSRLIDTIRPMAESTESPRSRRDVLRLVAVPLAVGLAGCTDGHLEDVERVVVENWHDDAHAVAVTVLADGTEHLSRTVEVPPVTEYDDRTAPGRVTIDETIPGPGVLGTTRYEVRTRLDGGEPEIEVKTTSEGFDDVEVRIDDDGSVDIAFMDAV